MKHDCATFFGMVLDPEQQVFVDAILNPDKLIVFCDAKAGTGKTTLAMGAAELLVKDKSTKHDGIVYIASPCHEAHQGYLPGTLQEKSDPYFSPCYQALATLGINPNIALESDLKKKYGEGYISTITHSYLRGTNFENKVCVIDEAQNYTVPELKKVLTRCHDSCKVIVIGHTEQQDTTERSGFAPYIRHFYGVEWSASCKLTINHRGKISTHADAL